MASPRATFDRPAKSISRLCGVRSIHVECSLELMVCAAMPAETKSGVGDSRLSAASLSCSISLDVLLAGAGDAKRVGGDVVGDHGACSSPRAVSDRHGRDEHSVAGGADVAAD